MHVFYDWRGACRYLKSLIVAARPLSGRGIVVEHTPEGTRINCTGLSGGGDPGYRGMFAGVISADGSTLYITDTTGVEGPMWSDGAGEYRDSPGMVRLVGQDPPANGAEYSGDNDHTGARRRFMVCRV